MRLIQIHDEEDYRDAVEFVNGLGYEANDKALQEKRDAVRWIVESVQRDGDAAVAEFTERFDRVTLEAGQFEVTPAEIEAAVSQVDPALLAILERAHENIRRFHAKSLRESWEETQEDGTVLGQRITPIERVGVYVPGGKAFYPSSVLMNIVPARVAGVKEIVMVSPPSHHGGIHPVVLAAARMAGATRVFRIGGAQAVAALAFGTGTVPAVMKITGPGNMYVAVAKSLVRGRVEIDSEAGPSEVVVIADAKADPAYVAAELLAQAEHDEDAVAILLTPAADLADAVLRRIREEIPRLARRAIIEEALEKHGRIYVVRSLDDVVDLTNRIAPEHLSVQVEFPRKLADRIQNAGAIMLGGWTPVAVGDYYAGPNHILPTGRRARFQSPLTAEDFRKVTNILYYSRDRLRNDAQDIVAFAQAEDLQAHARAIEVRQ